MFAQFVANYSSKWQSRTFCASGYVIERCANFKGSGHSASAPPTCYEANPKGGRPKPARRRSSSSPRSFPAAPRS